jgi:hypothetical protein
MRLTRFAVWALLLGPSMVVLAKGKDLYIDARDFDAHRARIEASLDDVSQLSELTRSQRDEIRNALSRMHKLLATAESVEALSPEAKMRIFNEQERVNTLLSDAKKQSRVICRAERPIGSNLKTRRCRTVAEIERERDASKQGWERLNEQRIPPPQQ